ncbi:Alpha/Beta hydrolase protein [Baffinella frigidus]|nr:Alpha/Beta hydrolase protein [Cryptophyta sp. CCMP2293]
MDFFDHTPHDTMDFLDHKPPDRGTHFPEHQTSRSPQSVCHDSPPPSFVFPTFPSHHATHVSVADPKPVAPVAPLVPNATRGLIQTDLGMVHFVDHLPPSPSGASPHRLPLVCMHMSPRSTDEFYEVGRLLAEEHGRRVIAVDESGYGQSDNPSRSCTIHDVALTVVAVLDHLAIPRAALCGSLMGCYTALALASQHPERVALLILTHPYFFGDEAHPIPTP